MVSEKRAEQLRRAQAKYQRTAKGKAAHAKYRRTPAGRRVIAKSNAQRIFIGDDYHCRADTLERAAVIRTHVRQRLHELKQRQSSRAEAEGAA